MDYKKLLHLILPQIIYKVGELSLVYHIDYIDVSETTHIGCSKCIVKFNRLDKNNKYSVANKVLCTVLNMEYDQISKYMGNTNFIFTTNDEPDVCI